MNEVERWIYLDGPEPPMIRELLDLLYDLGPETPEEEESGERAILAQIDAAMAASPPRGAEEAPDPGGQHGEDATTEEPRRRTAAVLVEEVEPPPGSAPPNAPVPSILPAMPAMPAYTRPPASLASTAPALDLPPEVWKDRGRMPFLSEDQVPPERRAAKTVQLPVMRIGLGETVPDGNDSIANAVAALPFVARTAGAAGAGIATIPDLGLTGYASLLAELTVKPEETAEILRKYRVPGSSASRRALDDHWRQRLAAHPEERVAFERACAVYTDYVRSKRG